MTGTRSRATSERFWSGRSVVTVPQVRAIRRLSRGGMSQRALAREFGISKTQAARIIRGESWAWLA